MATPKITWGTAFANTWTFPGAVDNPRPYASPIGAGSESEAGNIDWWEVRDDEEITLDVRMVPKDDTGSVTGYATATTGVREALKWLAKAGAARYYPDAALGTFHNVKAIGLVPKDVVNREPGGARYRIGPIRLRDTDAVAFTEY